MIVYVAWWTLFAGFQAYSLNSFGVSWQLATADAVLFTLICVVGSAAAGFVFRFYQPGPGGWIYRFTFAAGISLLGCFVFYEMMQLRDWHEPVYQLMLRKSMPVRFIVALLLLLFHIVLMWMLSVLEEQDAVNRRKSEAEALSREAELASLRQQLHPHFLFNSLNSISALAGGDPSGARKMIQQLSDFLRGTLKKDESLLPVTEELSHLQLYLDIEKVRFGHRLAVNVEVAEECAGMLVPPLLLQPVVENAIKFGLYGVTGSVTISIAIGCRESLLVIKVTNPFDPSAVTGAGTGFGLRGVTRRLQLLYGRPDLVSTKKHDSIFETELLIPQ